MVVASVSVLGYFVPIFAFLLVFIVVYALLAKTGVLGGSQAVMLFISFILAAFFVVQVRLVELVEFGSAWISVFIVGLFFLLVVLAFLPGKDPLAFLTINNWFSWVVLGIIIALFIISSAYVFNWAVNWGMIKEWFVGDVFGAFLLLIIAVVISFIIARKVKG